MSCFLGFAEAKVRIKAKQRTSVGTSAGEMTTHELSYTGMATRAWAELPKASRARKQNIVGSNVPLPELLNPKAREACANGEPLLFNDFNSIIFLAAFFEDLDAGFIFDLSPGNGGAAVAAALAVMEYVALCPNAGAQKFLEGVMDRALLALLTDDGKDKGERCERRGGPWHLSDNVFLRAFTVFPSALIPLAPLISHLPISFIALPISFRPFPHPFAHCPRQLSHSPPPFCNVSFASI